MKVIENGVERDATPLEEALYESVQQNRKFSLMMAIIMAIFAVLELVKAIQIYG